MVVWEVIFHETQAYFPSHSFTTSFCDTKYIPTVHSPEPLLACSIGFLVLFSLGGRVVIL